MSSTIGTLSAQGKLNIKVIRAQRAPLSWRLENTLRRSFITGWLNNRAAHMLTCLTGIPTMTAQLSVVKIEGATGNKINYGVVSYKVVTSAFVNFLASQLQTDTTEIGDFKYHDSGVGTTAEATSDTGIQTTDGESRATGTQVASTNTYQSVGTISYTTTKAITEHGLFSQSSAGTLMDRSVFSAINVVNGDSIQFTYTLTLPAGG